MTPQYNIPDSRLGLYLMYTGFYIAKRGLYSLCTERYLLYYKEEKRWIGNTIRRVSKSPITRMQA